MPTFSVIVNGARHHLTADSDMPLLWALRDRPWRAVEYPPTMFARESFLDEMAHAAGRYPLEFRLQLLQPGDVLAVGDQKIDRSRLIRVLQLAGKQADWKRPISSTNDRQCARSLARLEKTAG